MRRKMSAAAVVAVVALAVVLWQEFPAMKRYYNMTRM
jgi:hypothetical protein